MHLTFFKIYISTPTPTVQLIEICETERRYFILKNIKTNLSKKKEYFCCMVEFIQENTR